MQLVCLLKTNYFVFYEQTPMAFNLQPYKLKNWMKKSQNTKNHVLAQENGFGPAFFLHAWMRVLKGIVKSNTSRGVTAAPYF
jgi:hypothetical protein